MFPVYESLQYCKLLWSEFYYNQLTFACVCFQFFADIIMNRNRSPRSNRAPQSQSYHNNNNYASNFQRPPPRPCSNCGIQGHHANYCPRDEILRNAKRKSKKKRKHVTFLQDQSSSSSSSSSASSSEEEIPRERKRAKKKSRTSRKEIQQAAAFSQKHPGRIQQLIQADAETTKLKKQKEKVETFAKIWADSMGLPGPGSQSNPSPSTNPVPVAFGSAIDPSRSTNSTAPDLSDQIAAHVHKLLPAMLKAQIPGTSPPASSSSSSFFSPPDRATSTTEPTLIGNSPLSTDFSILQEQVRLLHEKNQLDAEALQEHELLRRDADILSLQEEARKKIEDKEATHQLEVARLNERIRLLTPSPPPQPQTPSPSPPFMQQSPFQSSPGSHFPHHFPFPPPPWQTWMPGPNMPSTPSPLQPPVVQTAGTYTTTPRALNEEPEFAPQNLVTPSSSTFNTSETNSNPNCGLGWTQVQEDELLQLQGSINHLRGLPLSTEKTALIEAIRENLLTLVHRRRTAREQVQRARDIVKEAQAIASPRGFAMLKEEATEESKPPIHQHNVMPKKKTNRGKRGYFPKFIPRNSPTLVSSKPRATKKKKKQQTLEQPSPEASDSSTSESKSEIMEEKKGTDSPPGSPLSSGCRTPSPLPLEDSANSDTALPQRVRVRLTRAAGGVQSSMLNHYAISPSTTSEPAAAIPPPRPDTVTSAIQQLRKEYINSLMLQQGRRTSGRKWDVKKLKAECVRLDVPYTGSQLKKLASKLSLKIQ